MADCKCILWCIFWLLVLFFIGWPISIFLGGIYGFVAPLTTCCGLEQVTELLLQGVNLSRTCAQNAKDGKSLC